MQYIKNENGMALITSLMFTMLSLVMCMSLLYMVTAGIKTTGALKRYKTALDATYGGTEQFTKELIGKALEFENDTTGATFNAYMMDGMGALADKSVSDCFHMRLTQPKRFWSAACENISSSSPDVSFQFNATSMNPYRVYANIVDTSEYKITSITGTNVSITTTIAGNSDPTGGSGSTANDASGETGLLQKGGAGYGQKPTEIPHYPYIYKIEIQGERQSNPAERGNVTVLYALNSKRRLFLTGIAFGLARYDKKIKIRSQYHYL